MMFHTGVPAWISFSVLLPRRKRALSSGLQLNVHLKFEEICYHNCDVSDGASGGTFSASSMFIVNGI